MSLTEKLKLIAVILISLKLFSGCSSVSNSIYIDTNSPIQEKKYSPTLSYRIVESVVKKDGIKSTFTGNPEDVVIRAQNRNDRLALHPPARFYRNFIVTETVIDNRSSFIITPKKNIRTDRVVFFLHGGGLMVNIEPFHWDIIERIVKELSIPLCVSMYPVYPEINPDVIISFVDKAFINLYETYPDAQIIAIGDSSGAFLQLSYCHYLTENNALRFPDKLIVLSPCQLIGIDEETINEMRALDTLDIAISADALDTLPYLFKINENDLNYFNTPLYGDFSRFPPITVFIGTHEVFYPLMRPFVEHVRSQGKEITLYTGRGMMHVWPYMPVARESKHAFKIILEIIGN